MAGCLRSSVPTIMMRKEAFRFGKNFATFLCMTPNIHNRFWIMAPTMCSRRLWRVVRRQVGAGSCVVPYPSGQTRGDSPPPPDPHNDLVAASGNTGGL